MLIRQDLSIRGINTREILTVAQAALKHIRSICGGGIILAPDTIVNMFAIVGGIRTARVACFQAELSSTHEIVPFNGLDVIVGVPIGCGEGVGEKQSAERVSALISAVRVQFSSIVSCGKVDEGLVD